MPNKEPKRLARGKAFHRQIQEEWLETAQGIILPEKTVQRLKGRKGRIDIFVDDDDPDEKHVAIVEIKASDWDRMKSINVRRNALRHSNQIWSYIDTQLDDLEGKTVSPGIIYQKRPTNIKRLEEIERILNNRGIQVVWHDESMEELKKRMS